MIDHKVCKNCGQRRNGPEYTEECPSKPMWGHQWKKLSGNGVKWHESYVGKLWKTKVGKILILGFLGYIIVQALF